MAYSLTWLPNVLLEAGLKVSRVDGWEFRGHGDMGQVFGVICHHTATPQSANNMPTLRTLINGRPDLSGPLAQLGLGRDGTYYVVAAGCCYHAGGGIWNGISAGNTHFIGIEAENSGQSNDPWPPIQMEAYHHGVAAILSHVGRGPLWCAGHKEFALPAGRKNDPTFEMASFRASVASIMNTNATMPQIPSSQPTIIGGSSPHKTLRRPMKDAEVLLVKQGLGIPINDDDFDAATEAAVRAFQRTKGLVPDGIVGPKTWALL